MTLYNHITVVQKLFELLVIEPTDITISSQLLSQPNPNLNHNLNPNTTKKLGETR